MSLLASVLAIGWEPELRGILIVIIAVAVLNGSIYLLLGTNLGARLGFLVAPEAFYQDMSGTAQLDYLAHLSGRPPVQREAIRSALELGSDALGRRIGSYS